MLWIFLNKLHVVEPASAGENMVKAGFFSFRSRVETENSFSCPFSSKLFAHSLGKLTTKA